MSPRRPATYRQKECRQCAAEFIPAAANSQFCGRPCLTANKAAKDKRRRGHQIETEESRLAERGGLPEQKYCSKCSATKPGEAFQRNSASPDGLQGSCRVCVAEYNTSWREKNPEYHRDYRLRKEHGTSLADYSKTLVGQNGVCAICSEPCPTGQNLAQDHNHANGCNRGLLCLRCNTLLGQARDSAAILQKAINYLLEWEGVQ
jgi:hypothetical protein